MKFDPRKIYFQAHRGGGGDEAPDNTLAAIRYGWSLGGIPEVDIRLTADDAVVCLHDNTLARTTDAPPETAQLPIRQLTAAQLRQYDAGRWFAPKFAGARVPFFKEVLQLLQHDPSRMIYADIKNYDPDVFPTLKKCFLELLSDYGCASQIIVCGCDYALNREFKAAVPALCTMQWIGYWGPDNALAIKLEQFSKLSEQQFAGLDLVQMHLQFLPAVSAWHWDVPAIRLREMLAQLGPGLEIFMDDGFDDAALDELLNCGVRRFATDEPGRLSRALAQRNLLPNG